MRNSTLRFIVALSLGLSVLGSAGSAARAADFCLNPALEDQPILADGRVTPLKLHAARVKKFLFPSKACSEISATALYCYLSFNQRAEVTQKYKCSLNLKVDHEKTLELLGLTHEDKSVSLEAAQVAREKLVNAIQGLQQKGQESSGFGSDIGSVLGRMEKLGSIESGMDWKILTESHQWIELKGLQGKLAGLPDLETALVASRAHVTEDEAKSLKLETLYESTKPFSFAILICLAGFLFSILAVNLPKFSIWAALSFILLMGIEIYGMALRVMVSGRAPVTNMYETVMWSGFGIFTLSIVLGLKLKDKRIWAVGFAGNSVCLFMMSFASTMLDSTIQPLVPVLRDNFWLSTHVTTITLSYACLALSWFICNFVLIRYLFGTRDSASIDRWNYVARLSMQIGAVFLAAGIILGGIWADYSWGRFWGWDPKETWSLIALVIYIAILHGRHVGWFKGLNFTLMGGFGFMFVLMAWFGVNYILAVGLHSYGFSSGGAAFLISIFTAELVLLLATYAVSKKVEGSAKKK